ncbi:MAG: hypothetical protein ACO1SV_17570 [Fimbriimonas sp.]
MFVGLLLLPAKVSLEAHAEPVGAVVARLAEKSGTSLLCASEVAPRRVVIFARNVDPERLRTQLAHAVDAEWVKTPAGLRLEFTSRLRKESRAQHLALRERWVSEALRTAGIPGPSAWTEADAARAIDESEAGVKRRREAGEVWAWWETSRVLPASRAAYRVLREIGPKALGDLAWGERRVWSTRGSGRYLRPLDRPSQAVVAVYNREHAAMREAAKGKGPLKEPLSTVFGRMHQGLTEPLAAPAEDITLIVRRTTYRPDLLVEVLLSAKDGRVVDSSSVYLLEAQKTAPEPPKTGLDLWTELPTIPVNLSAQTRSWRDITISPERSKEKEKAALLQNPERHEPLDVVFTDAFQAVARQRGLNVVAAVEDVDYVGHAPFSSAEGLRYLFSAEGANVQVQDDWLVRRVKDREEADRSRLSRSALGDAVRAAYARGYLAVDDRAGLLRATDGLENHPIVGWYMWPLMLNRNGMFMEPNVDLLSTVAILGNSPKGTLGSLPAKQRAVVARFVLERGSMRFARFDAGGNLLAPTIDMVPNIAFPNGLPDAAQIEVRREKTIAAYPVPIEGTFGAYMAETPESLATTTGRSPADFKARQFRMGVSKRISLTLRAPGDRVHEETIMSDLIDLTKPAVSFDALPPAFRRQVEAARKDPD